MATKPLFDQLPISAGGYMSVDRVEAFNNNLEVIQQITKPFREQTETLRQEVDRLKEQLKVASDGLKKVHTTATKGAAKIWPDKALKACAETAKQTLAAIEKGEGTNGL